MENSLIILIVCFASFCDLGLNAYLAYLSSSEGIFEEFTAYSFGRSFIDILALSYLRFVLIFGTLFFIIGSKNLGVQTLKNYKRTTLNFAVILSVLLAIKLLYFAEDSKVELESKFSVKALFAFSAFSNVILYFQWIGIRKLNFEGNSKFSNLNLQERNDDEETQSLLSSSSDSDSISTDASETSEDGDKNNDKKSSKRPSTRSVALKLIKYSKPDTGYILLGVLALLTASICEIFLPYFSGQVINGVAIVKSDKMFKKYILLMALVAIGASVASAFRAATFTYCMARFTVRIQNHLFSHIMKQEIGFFDKEKTGSIISRLTSDTTKMGDQISLNANIFLRSVVKMVGILIFMAKLSWKLTIVTIVGTPILAMIAEAYGEYYEKISKKVQDSLALANNDAQESISSIRTVRSFAAEEIEIERYGLKLKEVFKLKIKEAIASGGFHLTAEMCFLAMECLVLFYGGHLVINGDLSGGNLVAFSFYSFDLSGCIEEISDVYTSLMEAIGASHKVFQYLEREPKILNDGVLKPPYFKGSIEFKQVTFSYPSRPDVPVLENVSFTVSPGEVIALVGPSGGGKSTIVKLLEHFYEPQSGSVLIDNIPVQDYDHRYIHNRMTLVAQEPILFARSIADNITYGKTGFEEEKIIEAAKNSNSHGFISDMPEGYKTQTGEKGIQLSGGQKQRVAIARALIRSPNILILDEATSALDAESESQVQEALNRNLAERTVIIIAHRLSTIEKANKILVVEKGHLVEQGTHSELMKKGGIFARLMEKQLLGNGKENDKSAFEDGDSDSSDSDTSDSLSYSPPKSSHSSTGHMKVGFSRK